MKKVYGDLEKVKNEIIIPTLRGDNKLAADNLKLFAAETTDESVMGFQYVHSSPVYFVKENEHGTIEVNTKFCFRAKTKEFNPNKMYHWTLEE